MTGHIQIKNIHNSKTHVVEKAWGREIIFVNNDLYCGKILEFNAGSKFSMHYHMVKNESWYVSEGEFIYRWINTDTAEVEEERLNVGDVIGIPNGLPHQLEAVTGGKIFEVSTTHYDRDSYRVLKGDSQQ